VLAAKHRARVYTLTGLLLREAPHFILRLDNGGWWPLDAPMPLDDFVGQRLTLEGTRFGFNGIDVMRFRLENGDWLPERSTRKFKRWVVALAARLARLIKA
jgi:Protein of unknown function (DUF5818)